jgi:drug/metabolite transporter (DMT)-like permease
MVMVADLLIMIGLPIALFVIHRLWPEAVERRKSAIFGVLFAWFAYTFFGSRIVRGESITMIAYSALIVAVLTAIMVIILKQFPDQARKNDRWFRFGFMAAAAASMIVGWRLCV